MQNPPFLHKISNQCNSIPPTRTTKDYQIFFTERIVKRMKI